MLLEPPLLINVVVVVVVVMRAVALRRKVYKAPGAKTRELIASGNDTLEMTSFKLNILFAEVNSPCQARASPVEDSRLQEAFTAVEALI
jgi:hypothetical protein